jgi:glycosyltransferase involved in cell wall biosynthesis
VRILHVCADAGISLDGSKGASIHLRSIASAFTDQHKVVVVVRRRSDVDFPFVVDSFEDGVPLASVVDRHGEPDVIYERYSLGHVEGLELARRLGCPFILEVNSPLVAEANRHRPGTVSASDLLTELRLFREADLVVAVSTPLQDHVASVRGDRAMTVEHNGFDPALFVGDVKRDEAPTVGFLGHPKPWHGADTLPGIVAELRQRGHDARLLVVGGGPGIKPMLEAARVNGVVDHMEVTGPLGQADAIATIRRAWVGLAPYPAEEFFYFSPIKIVEYLAAGIPVVSTRLGDVPDLVAGGGKVVAAGDPAAFVDAVDALLRDPTERDVLGLRGRARMEREQTWRAIAHRTIDAVRELAPVEKA